MTFSDCLFLPDHSHYLISVSKLKQNGAQVNFEQSLSNFVKGRATVPFEEHANLYVLKGKTFDLCSSSGENEEAVLWHHRLGHKYFKMWNFWLIMFREWAWNTVLLINFVVAKSAKFLSHDGNQYREKWRKENLRNLISFSLTFWDRCQLLRLVAIDKLFLLRIACSSYP